MLKARLGHVTLYADNPDLLGAFYRDLFGMEIVGRATNGSSIFLGGRPQEENHEVAFIHNRKAAHLGLRVESPSDLLNYYEAIKARGLKLGPLFNHGMALALTVQDPEGNLIEIYWPTGREEFAPPEFTSLELEGQTEESLRRLVAEMPSPRPLTARKEP
jgi:catechol-2,3-dioxygenase